MQIASLTLQAIEDMCARDGGALYRSWLAQVLPHIGDAYRSEEESFRSHLGASTVGGDCSRAVWYGFRWVKKVKFSGRLYRLFNRGHIEEGRIIAALLAIGYQVFQQDGNGKQFRITGAGGHYGGSGDGVVYGVLELPHGEPVLLECKTSNEKNFKKLKDEGVRVAKFEHYVQMNQYMLKMGLRYALYMCVNKNDDEIHAEIVTLNPEIAMAYFEKGEQLVFMPAPPKKLHESPGWFACKFCDYKDVCHNNKEPEKNCRTCKFATPLHDGTWHCGHHAGVLTKEQQLAGCSFYDRAF